jgi:glycosyltransferase 2 family protein
MSDSAAQVGGTAAGATSGHEPPAPLLAPPVQRKRRRALLIKSAFSALLLYWVLRNVALRDVVDAMLRADLVLIAACFGMNMIGWALSVVRWRVLMKPHGVDGPPGYLLQAHLVGIFFNNLLPSTIGGDASRAYDSWRLGLSKTAALTVIFVDRFFGVAALLIFAMVAVLLPGGVATQLPFGRVWILAVAAVIGAVGLALLTPIRRGDRSRLSPLTRFGSAYLEKLTRGFEPFRSDRRPLALALGLSLLLQLNVIVYFYLIARALGVTVPFGSFFAIIPIALFIMMVPISVNAIGVRENVFAYFFAVYAVTRPEAVAYAWLVYALVLAQGLIGGAIYVLRRSGRATVEVPVAPAVSAKPR